MNRKGIAPIILILIVAAIVAVTALIYIYGKPTAAGPSNPEQAALCGGKPCEI